MHLRLHRRLFPKASLACSADLSQVPSLWNAGVSSPVILYVPPSQFSLILEHSVLLAPRIRARPGRKDSFGGMLPRKFLYQLLPGKRSRGGKKGSSSLQLSSWALRVGCRLLKVSIYLQRLRTLGRILIGSRVRHYFRCLWIDRGTE